MTYQRFGCSKHVKNKAGSTLLRGLIALIFVSLSLTLVYNFQIVPSLIPFAKAKVATEITRTVQAVAQRIVSDGEYSDFMRIIYDSNGDVAALETNSASVALVSGKITTAVIEELNKRDTFTVGIPVGNLSGGAIFAGKGPNIKIKVKVSPKITYKIDNEFFESGINQTLHRILIGINVESYALLPLAPQEIDVDTEYCIAETVIVGKVPEAYTKINRFDDDFAESDIDDIYDFGATLD